MDRLPRIVLGYHGCRPEFAEALIRGEVSIDDWKPSENPYDWLGHGIYFWEYGPERAKDWGGAVVGAVINLGVCLDLTDVSYTALLEDEYGSLRQVYEAEGRRLPENTSRRRDLDCLVINRLVTTAAKAGIDFQTVRCPFLEGRPAFPGSKIRRESHIQVAVRDRAGILGVFRPNLG
jgi:hypothetical protein